MITAQDFEEGYRDRALRWMEARGPADHILLGDTARVGHAPVLAGWWHADGDDPAKLVLPNPWDERIGVTVMEQRCWEVTESVVRKVAPVLDQCSGITGGANYWRTVLGPWLLILVSGVADRDLFLAVAAAIKPRGRALGVPAQEPPATMAESLGRLRDPVGNAALMGLLAPAHGLSVDPAGSDGVFERSRQQTLRGELARLALGDPRFAADLVADRGVAIATRQVGRLASRRSVVVVGQSGLHGLDELALIRHVHGLRFPRGTPKLEAMPPTDPLLRRRLAELGSETDPLEDAVFRVLPHVTPRSVVEGFRSVQASSVRGYGASTNVVVGNYAADEVQNEFIARCERDGRSIAFAQHGGFYGQALVHAQERLEIREGAEFWSWGAREEPQARRVASPWLSRLRDSHIGGDRIVLVEGVHPPDRFVLRFASTPLANQAFGEAGRLATLVGAATASRRRMVLKRYPPQASEAPRPKALAELPHEAPQGARGAAGWMQRAALAVVGYPDTPFLEALVIGVPTIGLWDPALYEWRPDVQRLVTALADARVIFADPELAARHIDAVADDPWEWWRSPETVAATANFVERLAPRGDWRADWTSGLRRLLSDRGGRR